jgi:hypothetical protein
MEEKKDLENKELEDKDLELFKKLIPYLFEEQDTGFLKWLPLISLILNFITLLVVIFKIK